MGRIRHLVISTILVALPFLCFPVYPEEAADCIDVTFRDDFEPGELNAWESYPYAQDPGFDPDIMCVREPAYAGSSFSLARIIEPDDTDFPKDINRLGMTKKCRVRTTPRSEISCAVFLDSDRKAQELRIILCSGDGVPYEWIEREPPANTWIAIRRPAADFSSGQRKLGPGVMIEAVAVVARYGPVNPHRSYTINLDDFELTGAAERRFIGEDPATTYFDKFNTTAFNRHINHGEDVSISVKPQQGNRPVTLKSVACTIIDSGGAVRKRAASLYDDGSHGDRAGSDGVWSSSLVYRVKPSDPSGIWRIELEGITADGKMVRDTWTFLVPVRLLTPEEHPRLFFSEEELAGLSPDGKNARKREIFDRVVASARNTIRQADIGRVVEDTSINREYLDGGTFSPTWDDYSRWSEPGYHAAQVVESGALLFALTGDREAGLKAKEFLLRIASFSNWNHPWYNARHMYSYYPVGLWCQSFALGYDLLYPLMTADERTYVRTAIMEKAVIPHYRDFAVNNRIPSNITNHFGMKTTGILLSLLTFLGDDPENPYMEPYLSGILAKYKAHIDAGYLPDGSYGEPVAYTDTDSEPLVKCLYALERNLGIDWTTTTRVRSAYYYPAYAVTGTGLDAPTFGDGGRDYGAGLRRLHLWLAHRTGDPLAFGRYLWQNSLFPGREDLFDYLWLPENLKPQPFSELPPSRWFRSKGDAVFRSGWNGDDLIFVFRCGPHSNHYHLDQGTFWLVYNNEPLITEAGVVNYYRNLYYRQFYIQPIAHNTVLLNGYPESQSIADFDNDIEALGSFPKITSCFTGATIDAVEGDLTCVYKERLTTFRRSFVFVKPDYLIMFDDLASPDNERFTWIFHADGEKSMTVNGSTITISRPEAQLRMEVLAPNNLTHTIQKHVDQDMCFVRLDTPEPSTAAGFIAALIPSKAADMEDRAGWKTTPVSENGWLGAEVTRTAQTDRVLFRTGEIVGTAHTGGFETDGDRFAVTMDTGGALVRCWVRNATVFSDVRSAGGKTLIRSDSRLTAAVALTEGETVIEIDAEKPSKVEIHVPRMAAEVLPNGEKTRFSYDAGSGTVTVSVPEGFSRVAVR